MRAVALDRTCTSRKRPIIGTSITALGVGSILNGLASEAVAMVGLGALLTFIGVSVLAPTLARPFAKVLGFPMHKGTKMSGTVRLPCSLVRREST